MRKVVVQPDVAVDEGENPSDNDDDGSDMCELPTVSLMPYEIVGQGQTTRALGGQLKYIIC